MATIRPETVRITPAADLSPRWAAELGHELVPQLGQRDRELLQERVVGLGHGVFLAHLRTHSVQEPTLGAWKASDARSEERPWLWLVVLVPAGDPSRHLGWMAHLAAVLHDEGQRRDLMACVADDELLAALARILSAPGRRPGEQRIEVPSAPPASGGFRLVVAILKEVEYVDHLLQLFVEHEVQGATVLEARGMAEHLAAHMSLFAGFRSAFQAVGHSQLILTLVRSERTAEVLELVRTAAGGMTTPGSGVAFAVDVPVTVGLNKAQT